MSRYGSVTITGPTSLISSAVQSSSPADLQARVAAALASLPAGYSVVSLTLAGAGDGDAFTVTIEAGRDEDVNGGFVGLPEVTCYLASDASQLMVQRARVAPATGVSADLQVAGASKGTRFMGMLVRGTVLSGPVAPLTQYLFVDPLTTVPVSRQNGSIVAPFSTVQAAIDALAPAFGGSIFVTSNALAAAPVQIPLGTWTITGGAESVNVGPLVLTSANSVLVLNNAFADLTMANPADTATVRMSIDQYVGQGPVSANLQQLEVPAGTVTLIGIGTTGPLSALTLTLLNCGLGAGTVMAATTLTAVDCFFEHPVAMTFPAGTQIFRGCDFAPSAGVASNVDPLQMDTYSDARFTASGRSASAGVAVIG